MANPWYTSATFGTRAEAIKYVSSRQEDDWDTEWKIVKKGNDYHAQQRMTREAMKRRPNR